MKNIKKSLCSIFLILSIFTHKNVECFFNEQNEYNYLNGFEIYGDYLYWKVVQDQIPYAAVLPGGISAIIDAFNQNPVILRDHLSIIDPTFKYNSGFRIGIGYQLPCSHWDFQVSWICLKDKIHSSVSEDDGGVIPLSLPASSIFGILSTPPTFADSASSAWHFDYNAIDLEIGREIEFCECLNVRPFVGLKAAKINQKQHIEYVGFRVMEMALEVEIEKTNHFKGVGPSIGFDLNWQFFSNFSLTSGASGALLFGKFSVKDQPRLELNPNLIALDLENKKKNRIRPMVDAYIGIDWNQSYCDNFQFNIGIQYETQYWWNQWQAFNSFEGGLITGGMSPQGDLMMYGLTVHAAVSF